MTRYGMLINTKKCVGCYACRMACQMINKLEPEEAFISYKEIEQGTYPSVYAETVPVQCMHCENAPCQQVCPTHATYTTESGVVLVDEEKCIGCKYCMAACPYGVRIQIEKTCISGVRVFGDLDDPDSDISREIARTNAQPIAGDLTESKIYYVR